MKWLRFSIRLTQLLKNAMAQTLHNSCFSHQFSEAELECLLKVFIITIMVKPEHTNLKRRPLNFTAMHRSTP